MVYRGKPSAGCEQCRQAKKRCTLEQPACSRCMKLRKPCSGYRDTSELQIQDETLAVTRRAEKGKAHQGSGSARSRGSSSYSTTPGFVIDPAVQARVESATTGTMPKLAMRAQALDKFGCHSTAYMSTPNSSSSSEDSLSTSGYGTRFYDKSEDSDKEARTTVTISKGDVDKLSIVTSWFTTGFLPRPDEVATNYFLSCFTSQGHWDYVPRYAATPRMDPCLTLAIQACGMAALDNVQYIPQGRVWSRAAYTKALGLLNASLRDPQKSRTDESLIAVSVLSLYENLVCEDEQSIQSWKSHIQGATQLLKLRGTAQFKTAVGRNLFRETRAQIMIHCLWDAIEPPAFCRDWKFALQAASPDMAFLAPADDLVDICFDFAMIESQVKQNQLSTADALIQVNDIDSRMQYWAEQSPVTHPHWRYTDLFVPESPHIWQCKVHSYIGVPMAGVWNTYRSVRIMVMRSQEVLANLLPATPRARATQRAQFLRIRQLLTDDICATIPSMLGHAPPPAWNSNAVLITAYSSIWPLFFAGTCALDGASPDAATEQTDSAAVAQLSWILSRFDYISSTVGLRWADGVGATLRGELKLHEGLLSDDEAAHARRIGPHASSKRSSKLVRQIEATGEGMVVGSDEVPRWET